MKVAIVWCTESFDEYTTDLISRQVTDWAEISDEDYKELCHGIYQVRYLFHPTLIPLLLVQKNEEQLKTVQDTLTAIRNRRAEEQKKIDAENKKREKAKMDRQLKKKAKSEEDERKLLEELKKKYD